MISLCTRLNVMVPVMATIGCGFVLLLTGCGQSPQQEQKPVQKEAEYKLFSGEQRVTLRGYNGDAMEPFLSADGHYLLFNNRNEPPENTNLHYAERMDDLHFDYKGEIKGVNTPALEGVPSLDKEGNLYFVSPRDYEHTFSTLYRGKFVKGVVSGVELVSGVSRRKAGIVNFDAEISADGNTLYFVDGDFTGDPKPKGADMVIASRHGSSFERDPQSEAILKNVNGNGLVYAPAISDDGLELFYTRVAKITATAQPAIYRVARKHTNEPFGVPEKVSGITGFVEGLTLSADGHRLYYHKKENGRFFIYLITRRTT